MIEEKQGDILNTTFEVIAHQVNCMGVMGSGVALCLKRKWPNLFTEYLKLINNFDHCVLGGCQIVQVEDNKFVANLFGQYFYNGYFSNTDSYFEQEFWKRPEFIDENTLRFTNYEAIYRSLSQLKTSMKQAGKYNLALPKYIGCCRGGGNWNIINTMINDIFSDMNVELWEKQD